MEQDTPVAQEVHFRLDCEHKALGVWVALLLAPIIIARPAQVTESQTLVSVQLCPALAEACLGVSVWGEDSENPVVLQPLLGVGTVPGV